MSNELQNTAPEEQFVNSEVNETKMDDTTSKTETNEDIAPTQTETETTEDPSTHENTVLQYVSMSKEELLATLERLVSSEEIGIEVLRKEVEAIKSAFYRLLKQEQEGKNAVTEGEQVIAEEHPENEFEAIFKKIYATYKSKRGQHVLQLEKQKEQNLSEKLQIIEELKTLLEKQEDLNQTFPAFRSLQQRWKDIGAVPQAQAKNLWETYHHYVEMFYDYVKINNELRDLDLKKNLEAKIDLCEKTEALLLEPSVINAFIKLQKYHDAWREIGPIARELREQVWERFKNATASTNKKHQEYFEQQKEEQKKNFEAKLALCEKAEELVTAASETKTNKDWNETSKAMEDLQKIWKTIGFATKKENARIFERFRATCDKFYTAKREYYAQFKNDMQQNISLKENLCEQAEALKDNSEWKKTTDKLIFLQKQWKETGPVPRKQSEILWKRFRNACDTFFENKSKHFSTIDTQYSDNLTAKESLIEEINTFVPSANPEENLAALHNFQRHWTEIGFVPIKEKDRVQNTYRAAIDKLFQTLQIGDSDKKLLRFKNRIEEIQGGGNKGNRVLRSERDKLLQKVRQLESDIALLENNIGFFAKSKNAEVLIADVQQKIEKAKQEMVVLEEKIKLIDKQYE